MTGGPPDADGRVKSEEQGSPALIAFSFLGVAVFDEYYKDAATWEQADLVTGFRHVV